MKLLKKVAILTVVSLVAVFGCLADSFDSVSNECAGDWHYGQGAQAQCVAFATNDSVDYYVQGFIAWSYNLLSASAVAWADVQHNSYSGHDYIYGAAYGEAYLYPYGVVACGYSEWYDAVGDHDYGYSEGCGTAASYPYYPALAFGGYQFSYNPF